MSWDKAAEYAMRLSKVDRAQFWIDQSAPPPVRGRKREARRWIDLLTAVCFNPPNSQRRPDDGWLSFDEGRASWTQAHARLRLLNPELARAVARVEWEDSGRRARITTIEEFRRDVAACAPRLNRAYAEVRRAGRRPLSRDRIWAILGVPSRRDLPSTAEVAERQTR